MGTPVIGVQGGGYPEAGTWQVSFGWRRQMSDKHFVGSEYQENRTTEGSEVINHLNLFDMSVAYQATKRLQVSLGVPFPTATRSQALRSNGVLVERYQTQARGIGDVIASARTWLFDPDTHPNGNLLIGGGLKLPTGENNVTDTFRVLTAGVPTNVIRTVDQSIQPGDGGFGLIGDISGFMTMGKISLYASGAYLINPQEVSGVQTYRGGSGEGVMSIADQYLARGGAAFGIPGTSTMSGSFGVRLEGVPVEDLFGGSEGFRRPGIAISLEPIVTWTKGKHGVSLGVPFAIYRNRFQSVADQAATPPRHGDAAFADYLIMFGYTRRF